ILRGKPSERTSVGREFSIGIVTRRRKTLHFTYTRNKTRNLREQPRKFCRCCSRKFLLVEGRPGRGYHSGWGSYGSLGPLGPLGSIVSTQDKASATIVAPLAAEHSYPRAASVLVRERRQSRRRNMLIHPDRWNSLRGRDEQEKPRKMLALDGGGIRGLVTLGILEKIEMLV